MTKHSRTRLLPACIGAILCLVALSWLVEAGGIQGDLRLPYGFGYLSLPSLLVVFLAMLVGGRLGGRQFVPVALAITLVFWVALMFLMIRIQRPAVATMADAAGIVGRGSVIGILLSMFAAWAGARLGSRFGTSPAAPA